MAADLCHHHPENPAAMKTDIQTEEDIKTLVDGFYAKVRQDAVIGHIFNEVANVDWPHHLPTMYAFWATVLLAKEGYKGNAILKHLQLHAKIPLQKAHFDRWLALFALTVDENFAGPTADNAKIRAMSIATVLQIKIAQAA